VGATAGAPNVTRIRLVSRVGARIAYVIVRSFAVGHETLSGWTLALVGVVLDERGPAPSEVGAKRRAKGVSLESGSYSRLLQGSLAHLHTQSEELVRWVASVIDPARKVSQEEHAARE